MFYRPFNFVLTGFLAGKENLKYYLRSFSTILSIYSSAIRAITAAPTVIKSQDSLLIDNFAVASSISLIRISPTISNAFFFAAEELYPKELSLTKQESTLTLKEILKLFRASEIIAVYVSIIGKARNR